MEEHPHASLTSAQLLILRHLLPERYREEALGEIHEQFLAVHAASGDTAARKYIWFELRALILHRLSLFIPWSISVSAGLVLVLSFPRDNHQFALGAVITVGIAGIFLLRNENTRKTIRNALFRGLTRRR
jgi:hypothetical protein